MANQIKTRIILRNDTKENWTSVDPILLKGEMGIEIDTNNFKFGDGVKKWSELPYGIPDIPEDTGDAHIYLVDVEKGGDHVEAITAKVGENVLHRGDIAIVHEPIDDEGLKKQYTAYVYDKEGGNWEAMDGNYNASNVYWDADLTTTSQIGNISLSNGQATISAKGKSLKDVWNSIFVKEKDPSVTQPSVSVSMPQAKAYEVGTKVTPSFTASFNKGSYQYGPSDTGVTVTSWNVVDTASSPAVAANSGSFPELTVSDGMSYKITATANYGAGVAPVTNIGTEKPSLAIAAGAKSATSGAITGYRAWFCGAVTSGEITLDSASIRGLTNKGACNAGKVNMSIPAGATCVVIAVPQGRTVTGIADVNAFGTDIFSAFVSSQVPVEGVDGYTAQNYNVYKYTPSVALASNTYTITIA